VVYFDDRKLAIRQRSIRRLQTGRVVLLSLAAVALDCSLVLRASGQSAGPSSVIDVKTTETNRQLGESMLVSGQIRSAL
jgi:hypothetical protein